MHKEEVSIYSLKFLKQNRDKLMETGLPLAIIENEQKWGYFIEHLYYPGIPFRLEELTTGSKNRLYELVCDTSEPCNLKEYLTRVVPGQFTGPAWQIPESPQESDRMTEQFSIAFWKYQEGVYLNHQEVYVQLSKGIRLKGIDELPIDTIIQEITRQFPDWEHEDNCWRKNKEQFRLYTTPQLVRIDCPEMLNGKDMNKFPDIMVDFECPLYDYTTNRRFDEWELVKGENFFI